MAPIDEDATFRTVQWRHLRLQILERDGYRCQIKGPACKGTATQVDHIVPLADGGAPLDPANCRAACSWCNTWRAQRQKSREGWKRAATYIVLVMGPPAAGKTTYVQEHAGPGDIVIDYDAIARALSPAGRARHEEVTEVRGKLLTRLRRGELTARRAWIVTCDPLADQRYPYHEVVVIDPGKDEVLRRCREERALSLFGVAEDWYARRAAATVPAGAREW